MIYKQTKLKVVDNSGAKFIRVFHLLKYPVSQNYSCSGDLVLGSVLKYKANKKINRKQLCRVLIITSKQNKFRKNGNFVKFDENRGIVLVDIKKLSGTRIFGPISKEVKKGIYSRLLFITKKIV